MREEETRRRGFETGVEIEPATTPSVAEEATIASTGNNKACFNGRGGEDKCGGSKGIGGRTGCGSSSEKGSFCNGSRLGQELLCLWGIRAYGPPLQKLGSERQGSRK